MNAVRALFSGHRRLALVAAALCLCVKALIPAGYMVATPAQKLTIAICADAGLGKTSIEIEVPAKTSPHHDQSQGKVDHQCPFTSLSMAAVGGVSGPLLALAFAFILALGLAPTKHSPPRSADRLRPPLRGPPLRA